VGMGGNGLTAMKNPPHPAAGQVLCQLVPVARGTNLLPEGDPQLLAEERHSRDGVDPAGAIKPAEKAYQWYDWKYPVHAMNPRIG